MLSTSENKNFAFFCWSKASEVEISEVLKKGIIL